MKLKKIILCLIMFFVAANTTEANERERLLEQYKEDIAKIEEYIKGISNASGEFRQFTHKGSISGNFFLSRPGKMRLDYDFPVQYRLIVNDGKVVYYDKKLNQTNYLNMKAVPFSLLLSENVSFAKSGLNITNIEKRDNIIAITIKPEENSLGGSVTVFFNLNPVSIRKWTVIDVQNIRTDVVFDKFNYAIVFEDDFFKFEKPKPKKKKVSN